MAHQRWKTVIAGYDMPRLHFSDLTLGIRHIVSLSHSKALCNLGCLFPRDVLACLRKTEETQKEKVRSP